jgi:hypothetical protein
VNAETFNSLHPVGTPVFAYPGARPEDFPSDRRLVTRTRSKAEVLGGHTDVVWVDRHSACIALSHVDPVSEDVWQAAKEAEAIAEAAKPKDTLAPWLANRFDPNGAPWDGMSDDDRTYWEHQARAVRRAVARGGFKEQAAVLAPTHTTPEEAS